MELSTILTILTILSIISGATAFIIRWDKKRVMTIADDCIKESQKSCAIIRGQDTEEIRKRIKLLEENDISKQLTIVKIEATLENLTQGHEKTQTMILEMGGQFHEITSELIKTIQSIK